MILTDKIAKSTVTFIKNNTSTSDEDLEKIEYGIKALVSNFLKLVLLFLTAYFFGVLKYTLLAVFTFALIRSFASGAHANSTIQCIFINYLFFLGNVFISIYHPLSTMEIGVIFLISLILICLYSPADTAERPLVNKKLRIFLKLGSIITAFILLFISLIINNDVYKTIIINSILEESIAITPLLYKILGKSYRNYFNITL